MSGNAKYEHFYDQLQEEPFLRQSLENGSIPLLHIANHEFRDRAKQEELGKKGDIYVQNFQTSKERARSTQEKFRTGHLQEEEFDEKQPHKRHQHWLKVRAIQKEGPPLRYGIGKRTENERIVYETREGKAKWIDHSEKNTQMLHHPDWKPVQKNKWLEGKNFDRTSCLYQGPHSDPPWEEYPLRYNHEGAEYIDGYEKIGEKIYRYRSRKNEGGRDEFIGTISQDMLGKKQHISQSIRTFISQRAMGVDPSYDQFSKTQRLPYYKQALVETNSVDRQIPYFHSQNVRSFQTKDLMPRTDKIFKLSLKQYCPSLAQTARETDYDHQTGTFKPKLQLDSLIRRLDSPSFAAPTSPAIPNPNLSQSNMVPPKSAALKEKQMFRTSTSHSTQNEQQKINPISQKQSRNSMRTTDYTWNGQIRSFTSIHKKRTRGQQHSLKEKLTADPYYQPGNQEARDLVATYFP